MSLTYEKEALKTEALKTGKSKNKKSWLKSKIMLLGLVAVMLGLLLVGCGDATVGLPGNSATATPAPTTSQPTTGQTVGQPTTDAVTPSNTHAPKPTTPVTTTAPLPTATPDTTSAPAPTATSKPEPTATQNPQPTPTKDAPAYNPVIRFSATTLKVGDSLTISGSGYPANVKLNVYLSVAEAGLYGPYASPVVDANGKFTGTIKLATLPNGQPLPVGRIVVKVSTTDNLYGASAAITLTGPQAVYKPALEVAPQNRVKLGGSVTINGSGFPATLKLKVVGGAESVTEQYGSVVTDSQGRFGLAIKLPLTGIYPGNYLIFAISEGDTYQAKTQLEVYTALTPVLEASKLTVSKGDELTLSGSGYPPNTEIKVVAGVQNPNETFGTVTTDAQGSFQMRIKLTLPSVLPGPYFIYASTYDFVYQANIKVTVKG